jgi:predicted RecA/RadA family phage recombinase
MATNFVQNGDSVNFTAGADLSSGDVVVIGEQIGICVNDVANGASGVANMTGVFSVPKVSGAVITVGQSVIWDASAAAFDDNLATPATGDVSGACTAWESAGSGVTTIAVKLNTGKGTVA